MKSSTPIDTKSPGRRVFRYSVSSEVEDNVKETKNEIAQLISANYHFTKIKVKGHFLALIDKINHKAIC
ncbi:hypothetical protein CLOM_g17690 [Closterium sp. NIES-68]|nr:hypothetical protein CLOM_g17690 [Closterium sp. NIES-68]